MASSRGGGDSTGPGKRRRPDVEWYKGGGSPASLWVLGSLRVRENDRENRERREEGLRERGRVLGGGASRLVVCDSVGFTGVCRSW